MTADLSRDFFLASIAFGVIGVTPAAIACIVLGCVCAFIAFYMAGRVDV